MQAVRASWIIQSADRVVENAVMVWDKDRITEILPDSEFEQWKKKNHQKNIPVLDAEGGVVFPGFVNAHMHLYGVLSHGIVPASGVTDFESFLNAYWWPSVENRIRRKQACITARSGMAEMIRSGVTTFCDILEAPFCEEDTLLAMGEEIRRAGMRGVVGLESSERVSRENGERCLRMNAEAAKAFADDPLVSGSICTHTTFTCSPEMIREAKELARREDVLLQFHLSESSYEKKVLLQKTGKKPTDLYAELGVLDERTLATQCVKVDAEEREILRKSGCGIVHMPISNCEVGGGFAPVPEMLESKMAPALGTDGYINNFLEVTRAAFLIHKAQKERTDVMSAKEVFRMATENGARALGIRDAGILRPGMLADFVIYRPDGLTPLKKYNLFDQIAVFGGPAQISDVYVGGRPLMRDHTLTTLPEEEVFEEVRRCAADFWRELEEA